MIEVKQLERIPVMGLLDLITFALSTSLIPMEPMKYLIPIFWLHAEHQMGRSSWSIDNEDAIERGLGPSK